MHIEYTLCQPQAFYADTDGDGYGNPENFVQQCVQPANYVTNKSDCNDTDATINPSIIEIPYNGKDDDCNPLTKDDDLDDDGFALANDCNDTDATIHPNATEILYDAIDNNCNGVLDEGAQLLSTMQNCESTLSSAGSSIFCSVVNAANGYRFEVTGPSGVQTIDKSTNNFNFYELTDIAYSTTYSVRVMVRSSTTNTWVGYYGLACNYTLASSTTNSSNILTVCGQTLSSIGATLTAKAISGALGYRFRIINQNTGQVQILDKTTRTFTMTQLASFNYATNYSIDVATRTTSTFPANPSYGATCIVRTPALTKLTTTFCNKSIASKTTSITATSMNSATGYRFEVTRWTDSSLTQSVSVSLVDRTSNSFNFTHINNYAPSTYYTVRVSVMTSGTFPIDVNGQTIYGDSCRIFSPNIARMSSSANDLFDVKIIPNPFEYDFNINLETLSKGLIEVLVYDTIGRQLDVITTNADEISTLSIGERYPSGIYTIFIKQDGNQKVLRIIKK